MNIMIVHRRAGPVRYTPLAVWALLAAATAYVLAFKPTDRLADPEKAADRVRQAIAGVITAATGTSTVDCAPASPSMTARIREDR